MNVRILGLLCLLVSGHADAQTNAESEHEFFNDGSGEIEGLPIDELAYSQFKSVTFRPAPDFLLEPLKDSSFAFLKKMPNIEQLHIRCLTDPITETTATLISNCKKLKVLVVENAVFSQGALPIILSMPLEVIVLRGIPVSGQLQHLNTKQLTNLTLRHCGLQNKDATALANSPRLRYLDVHRNEYLDGQFVRRLGSLHNLKVFSITGLQLKVEDCQLVITNFPKLQSLNAETTSAEGEELLKSKLSKLKLLPAYDLGASPMWGWDVPEPE